MTVLFPHTRICHCDSITFAEHGARHFHRYSNKIRLIENRVSRKFNSCIDPSSIERKQELFCNSPIRQFAILPLWRTVHCNFPFLLLLRMNKWSKKENGQSSVYSILVKDNVLVFGMLKVNHKNTGCLAKRGGSQCKTIHQVFACVIAMNSVVRLRLQCRENRLICWKDSLLQDYSSIKCSHFDCERNFHCKVGRVVCESIRRSGEKARKTGYRAVEEKRAQEIKGEIA